MKCGLFHGKCHPLCAHPVLTGAGVALSAVGTVAVVSLVRRKAPLWGRQMKAAEKKCKRACGDLWQELKKEAENAVDGMAEAISSHMPACHCGGDDGTSGGSAESAEWTGNHKEEGDDTAGL